MPYSKWQSLTAAPLGFTVAFNVAEVCVSEDAFFVSTVGEFGSALNVSSEPSPVPPAFVAEIRKW